MMTTSDLNKLKSSDDNSSEAIFEAAKQFESIFLHQVFKSMRATVPKEGLMSGGFGGEVFTDMLDQQYADMAAGSSSLGLAESIARQLGAGETTGSFKLNQSQGLRRLGAHRAYQNQSTAIQWLKPVDGEMSNDFGPSRSMRGTGPSFRRGVTFKVESGQPVRAANGGDIKFAGPMNGLGNAVVIQHSNGAESVYGHVDQLSVAVGDTVKKGMEIGAAKRDGRNAAPGLYFEVRQNGRAIDPGTLFEQKK
ncbi:MAG: peptidoglycan DD-metalloendopeptidase family protein [Myxococcota bacterium]|nr:peptidoglycan DD-metalloendopeptidase family protein [Myxococcota bacterium]